MLAQLIILGTGGNAYDVMDIVDVINAHNPTWQITGFLDDRMEAGGQHAGLPVLGRLDDAIRVRDRIGAVLFVNAIGSDRSYPRRASIVKATGLSQGDFATLQHPLASVSRRANLGSGTYVCAHATVGGGAQLGNHVIVCPGAIIGHDAVIGDFSIVAPAACVSGLVKIGRSCYVGAQAVIRPGVDLADGSLVGMGAVVLKDTTEADVVVGNPARILERCPESM